VTWIHGDDILAFDCGPGNALLDDFVKTHTGQPYDKDGRFAKAGNVAQGMLDMWMRSPYFLKRAPKSLDREAWDVACVKSLSAEDGAATLAAFTVEAIVRAKDLMMPEPKEWLVAGGGRLNPFIMDLLKQKLRVPVRAVDALGWNGDATEAEGFAYLAVRSLLGLPLSLPTTTGVAEPLTGGVLHKV
jgi:anhydro-N-acetylmuramic acid kinase